MVGCSCTNETIGVNNIMNQQLLIYLQKIPYPSRFYPCVCIGCHKMIRRYSIYNRHFNRCRFFQKWKTNPTRKPKLKLISTPRIKHTIQHNCLSCNHVMEHAERIDRECNSCFIICRFCRPVISYHNCMICNCKLKTRAYDDLRMYCRLICGTCYDMLTKDKRPMIRKKKYYDKK